MFRGISLGCCLFGNVCVVTKHNELPSSLHGLGFVICFVGDVVVGMFCYVCIGVIVVCVGASDEGVVGEVVLCCVSEMCFGFIKAIKCGSSCCCCIVILWSDV